MAGKCLESLHLYYVNFGKLYYISPMKNILHLIVLLFFASFTVKAQKVYFIYLQTDNQQPFYARMGEKIYNSTNAGYLILSNLRDSNYSINIGIQGSQAPDEPYSITVNKKDQGFLIKNFGEKGWGLFNLSSMAVTMPVSKPATTAQTVKTEKRDDNAFTNLLAKAADDSTIKERPVVTKTEEPVVTKTEEKKTDDAALTNGKKDGIKETNSPKQEEIKKAIIPVGVKEESKPDESATKSQVQASDDAAKMKADSIAAAKKREEELLTQERIIQDSIDKARAGSSNTPEYKKSVVKLKSESSTSTGIGLVFIDAVADDKADTIRILIPAEIKKANPVGVKPEEKKFLDIPSSDSVQKENVAPAVLINNNCKASANDDDFFKVRKKMVSENTDNNMISEAAKVFKTKCFSTTQIRNLSTLFLTDEFKYKFFDASYPYVSDIGNFSSLQSELKDEYYITRFKAMLR